MDVDLLANTHAVTQAVLDGVMKPCGFLIEVSQLIETLQMSAAVCFADIVKCIQNHINNQQFLLHLLNT